MVPQSRVAAGMHGVAGGRGTTESTSPPPPPPTRASPSTRPPLPASFGRVRASPPSPHPSSRRFGRYRLLACRCAASGLQLSQLVSRARHTPSDQLETRHCLLKFQGHLFYLCFTSRRLDESVRNCLIRQRLQI